LVSVRHARLIVTGDAQVVTEKGEFRGMTEKTRIALNLGIGLPA
jgi:hypothetical protein